MARKKRKTRRPRRSRTPTPPARRLPLAEQPYSISEGVTQSLLSSFIDCRVRCKLQLEGWQMAGGTKESLFYGSLYHHLMEYLGKGVAAGDNGPEQYAIGTGWWGARTDEFLARLPSDADSGTVQMAERCIAQASGVWDGYLREYPADLKSDHWIELEGTFDAVWDGYRLRGKRDGMTRDCKGDLWLFESKTRSQMSANAEATIAFDFQSLFYLTANQAELEARCETGRIVGVQYNVIRKPQHKVGVTENLVGYAKRIAADVAKRPDHWFFRYEAKYSKKTLAEFQRQLLEKLSAFDCWLQHHDGDPGPLNATYRNEAACAKRWNCQYISYCAGARGEYERTGGLFVELEE